MSDLDPAVTFLPSGVQSPNAQRLQKFLTTLDSRLDDDLKLVVYGSAAARIYLADRHQGETGMTDDIDVGYMEPEKADVSPPPDTVAPPLKLRPHSIENWLCHPDWADATADASGLLGTQRLTIELLHPIDLILSKLPRALRRDLEDCEQLDSHLSLNKDRIQQRLLQALRYYPPSNHKISQIEYSFEYVLDRKLDLDNFKV